MYPRSWRDIEVLDSGSEMHINFDIPRSTPFRMFHDTIELGTGIEVANFTCGKSAGDDGLCFRGIGSVGGTGFVDVYVYVVFLLIRWILRPKYLCSSIRRCR